MRRSASLLLCALLLLTSATLPGNGQSPRDVLSRMIEALGGRKALAAIQDTVMSGTVELPQYGITASVTTYHKEPNKLRIDMDVNGMPITVGYDGRKGWFTDPQSGSTQEMPELQSKDFERQAMGHGALLDPSKLGIAFALKPKEMIDGKEYIVLEQVHFDGYTTAFFLDPTTYLPYKSRAKALGPSDEEVDTETYFSDYRKVENTVVAHAIRTLQGGVEVQKVTIAKVTYNSKFDDSLFLMR